MRSLESILHEHGSTLLLDASSSTLHAGWLEAGTEPRWAAVEQEAGTGIHVLLGQLAVSPNAAGAFVFCEGPGSLLGIRTVAAALRVWCALSARPIYQYRSLDLLARTEGKPGRTFICDARRRSWHTLTLDAQGKPGPIQRLATDELPSGQICRPGGFRTWTPLPSPAPEVVPYSPPQLGSTLRAVEMLTLAEDPDAFQPERPDYATWTPRVHQAPPA